ncbi:MAG: RNHCP domain-containing protein [Parcubacteria group bacterium]
MSLTFKRTKENFICDNCGKEVKGNGYTNHCPRCLWSKHVDANPGDRTVKCGGMMEPVRLDWEGGQFFVTHRCVKCDYEKKNIAASEDNLELLT